MADFKIAYNLTMGHEGGYSNDPADRGGETYKGVARKFWSGWNGWEIIDPMKAKSDFPKCLDANAELMSRTMQFYKVNFWDKLKCDVVIDQDVANELFDTSVNMGVSTAGKFLQEALNLLNRNQQSYPDVVIDGAIGDLTLLTLNKHKNPKAVHRTLNGLQFVRYRDICKNDPTQEKFFYGWLNRT